VVAWLAMPTAFDPADLRQANPPRGVDLPAPTREHGLELLRARLAKAPPRMRTSRPAEYEAVAAALERGTAPGDVETAAVAVRLLRADEAAIGEVDVDDVNDALFAFLLEAGVDVAFPALLRAGPVMFAQPAPAAFQSTDLLAWRAFARVLGRAAEADYARARERAEAVRKAASSPSLRNAIAMTFPSEPWATKDARAYLAAKSDAELRWFVKAAMVLCANDDADVAAQLVRAMLAQAHGYGTGAPALPALSMAYRFREGIAPVLVEAFEANVERENDYAAGEIARALACLGTPQVAGILAARRGKKVGGEAAARFAERFPGVDGAAAGSASEASGQRGAGAASDAGSARVAVAGDLEMPSGSLHAWRERTVDARHFDDWGDLAVPARARAVGEVVDAWSARVRFDASDEAITIRGVVDEGAYREGAAASPENQALSSPATRALPDTTGWRCP